MQEGGEQRGDHPAAAERVAGGGGGRGQPGRDQATQPIKQIQNYLTFESIHFTS